MRIKTVSLVSLGAVGIVYAQDKIDPAGSGTSISGSIDPPPPITVGSQSQVTFTVTGSNVGVVSLLLCQSSIDPQDSTKRDVIALNIKDICVSSDSSGGDAACSGKTSQLGTPTTMEFSLSANGAAPLSQSSPFYFFCLAPSGGSVGGSSGQTGGPACGPHSVPFNISPISNFPPDQASPLIPSSVTPILNQQFPLAIPGSGQSIAYSTIALTGSPGVTTTSIVTATFSPTATPSSANAVANDQSSPKGSSGLSIGAKVGIAIAAVVAVLIVLLLALFCLRRKHRQRSESGPLMLNQSLNADSRDLITEKEISAGSLDSPASTFATSSHIRNSSLSPYEATPSRPYSGLAAAIPRQSPTTNSFPSAPTTREPKPVAVAAGGAAVAAAGAGAASIPPPRPQRSPPPQTSKSALSRGVSNASTALVSPRSTTVSLTENFEEFRDIAVYGDARRSPQVFPGTSGSQQAPQGGKSDYPTYAAMSAEDEAARLREEEEERKIDAAIAEAEADRAKAAAQQHRI